MVLEGGGLDPAMVVIAVHLAAGVKAGGIKGAPTSGYPTMTRASRATQADRLTYLG